MRFRMFQIAEKAIGGDFAGVGDGDRVFNLDGMPFDKSRWYELVQIASTVHRIVDQSISYRRTRAVIVLADRIAIVVQSLAESSIPAGEIDALTSVVRKDDKIAVIVLGAGRVVG